MFFGVKKGIEKNTRPFIVFQDREIEGAFASCGFRVTARCPQFLLPMALHRGLALASVSRLLEAGLGTLGLTRGFGSPVILRLEPRG